ncbi:MAG: hypothetical protein IKX53_00845, partial [Bacteroidales bacterium]|nr:hypothetical protein [Bacteroidales bacterium]
VCSSWFAAGAELRSSPLTAISSLLASLRESNGRQTDAVTRRDFRLSAIFLPLTNRRIHARTVSSAYGLLPLDQLSLFFARFETYFVESCVL